MDEVNCPVCEGSRLKKEALFFKINEKNIVELCDMDISDVTAWFLDLNNHLSDKQKTIFIGPEWLLKIIQFISSNVFEIITDIK